MSLKRRLILILGVWIALMPFLGFPISWRKPIFLISGLAIAYLAYTLKNKIDILTAPEPKTYIQNGQTLNNKTLDDKSNEPQP
ncbi:hypothetical protein A3B93_00610 [Candidatus Nomurabacteria bacterium RIFCSPHIGHO2_02_FULL_42_24]|uniref:Uncharacterized protein n=1 Tax=Candidatus Nomurabacteria bacterium RIFCSPHIGHO2_02_FULL_42_24 TaxID=1801757 RepID=A0A1F6WGG4_9BACT|nr:MAG: hypothetical protein UV08_C0011G0010 [Parcubacteria group bacterium GW2011_GWA2_42_18]OGI81000.1 MAG: hypothetical protein A3B93_00610 [Candidatus Nomurabacteria bacterium RIFCSPHIGHO2_02_FULL_42_24]